MQHLQTFAQELYPIQKPDSLLALHEPYSAKNVLFHQLALVQFLHPRAILVGYICALAIAAIASVISCEPVLDTTDR